MAIKPILFNTEMVQAILEGRKSCTRRIVKPQPQGKLCYRLAGSDYGTWGYPSKTEREMNMNNFWLPEDITDEELNRRWNPPYHADDILYVRETWKKAPNGYYYYEDWQRDDIADITKWKPSIHMPKEAARIWLKVTNVRVERLQEITEEQTEEEGFLFTPPCLHLTGENYCDIDGPCTSKIKYCDMSAGELFGKVLWNSTIKQSDLERYGWAANPWVWVIKFERCEKPEGEN